MFTASDAANLRSFLYDTPNFLDHLRSARPALSGTSSEEKVNNACIAEGWELLLSTIPIMAEKQDSDEPAGFTPVAGCEID